MKKIRISLSTRTLGQKSEKKNENLKILLL